MSLIIAFDVDDTLYDLQQPFRLAVQDVFRNLYDEIISQVFLRTRVRGDELFTEFSTGQIPQEEYFCYRNVKGFEDCGVMISREEALQIQENYRQHQKQIAMSDEIRSMLQELKNRGIQNAQKQNPKTGRNVVAGIITNGLSDAQWKKIRTLGIPAYIDEGKIVISGDVGCAKPAPGIFKIAESRFRSQTRDTLEKLQGSQELQVWQELQESREDEFWYIGDTYVNDIEGAAGAGWHTIWFNRRNLPVPGSKVKPDLIARDEQELTKLIRELIMD